MGYNDHPQRYIIDVKKYAKQESWQWPSELKAPPTRGLDFDLFVSVQHVDYQYTNQDEEGYIPVEETKWDKMMFYPAFVRSLSQAKSLNHGFIALATSATALLLLTN